MVWICDGIRPGRYNSGAMMRRDAARPGVW